MVNDRTADLKERAKDWRSQGEDFAGEASDRIQQMSRKLR